MNQPTPHMTCWPLALEASVPAGAYFLGDPCYAVPGELWDELLASCDFFNAPIGSVKSHQVLAFSTAFGDGDYVGSDGISYGVDSGLIGLTPLALVPECERERLATLGSVVEFAAPVRCTWRDGLMAFGHVRIDTRFFRDDEPGEL